jgi:hypothetical protein
MVWSPRDDGMIDETEQEWKWEWKWKGSWNIGGHYYYGEGRRQTPRPWCIQLKQIPHVARSRPLLLSRIKLSEHVVCAS